MKGALLGRRELAAKEVDVVGVAGARPGVARPRQRGVGRGDEAPLVAVDVVNVQVVEELGQGAVEVLATKEQQVVAVTGRRDEARGGAGLGGPIADRLGDLEEELLLLPVFLEDLVEVDVLGVAALDLGGLGLGLLLGLVGLLCLFRGLLQQR